MMPKVRLGDLIGVGGFRENGFSDCHDLPSIADLVGEVPQPNEDRAVAYLRSAPGIGGRSGVRCDVLDPSSRKPMGVSIHSDGVYTWDDSLPYYVEKYHFHLPDHLLRHMEAMNWRPPVDLELDWSDWTKPPTIKADVRS